MPRICELRIAFRVAAASGGKRCDQRSDRRAPTAGDGRTSVLRWPPTAIERGMAAEGQSARVIPDEAAQALLQAARDRRAGALPRAARAARAHDPLRAPAY